MVIILCAMILVFILSVAFSGWFWIVALIVLGPAEFAASRNLHRKLDKKHELYGPNSQLRKTQNLIDLGRR